MDLCHPDSAEMSSGETEELQLIKWHRKQLLEDIQKLKDEIADVFAQIDCFESAEESRMAQREKELCIGRKKFNMDPVKGVQYLIEHKLLTSDVQDIARFLYKGEGLNKTAIGLYLGERDPVNLQVLQAFVDCHEFANLNLVQALRQFLWSFRLPGEAQKIDRMMETFATRYCLCNPGVFQSTAPLRQHQERALLHPGGRRKRPHPHLLQPGPRGLAAQAGGPCEDVETALVHPDRQLPLLLRVHHRQGATGDHTPGEPLSPEGRRPQEAILPGALQPQLPGPEDKGLQDGWRRQGGGGQARVLPDLGLQRRGAGPVDPGHTSEHHPCPFLRPGLCPEEEDRQQAVSFLCRWLWGLGVPGTPGPAVPGDPLSPSVHPLLFPRHRHPPRWPRANSGGEAELRTVCGSSQGSEPTTEAPWPSASSH
ncbi:cytohesin-4 isoform X1 [Choloepus didactylus]|uniref:cytohesin-4 isoform X1 n=1 Tax=Choloepus didactylus TaxID=27675 RepID=UPI0018A0C2B6|nr:cytohesin-4 isoform X1 [Choloepus didactylus]